MGRILPSIRGRGAGAATGPSSFASNDLQVQRRAAVIAAGQAASARMAGPDARTPLAPSKVDMEKMVGDRVTGFRELQNLRARQAENVGVPTVTRAVRDELMSAPNERIRRMQPVG